VARAMQQNIPVTGKREWKLGIFSSFRVFPLRDGFGKCFGALSFDTDDPDEVMLRTALDFLMSVPVDSVRQYERLSPEDGLMVVDAQKVIIAVNNKARHIFQVLHVADVLGRRTNDLAINWPLVGMVIDTGIAESKQFFMHGRLLLMKVLPVPARPKSNCAIVILQDITELHKKDEELLIKSAVIKEIHHRVKNNLQTIVSLLRLQERRTESSEAKSILQDCIGRVNSIAVVHEYLSQQGDGMIDVGKVAKSIYQALVSSMLNSDFVLETDFATDNVLLPSEKATSIALILNELLQNAIEHAFAGRTNGKLTVRFNDSGSCYELLIADNGVGLPPDFSWQQSSSLGLKIIKTMAEADLKGSFALVPLADGGVQASVIIPKGGVEK
jgi:two-component sensor histidine kinase